LSDGWITALVGFLGSTIGALVSWYALERTEERKSRLAARNFRQLLQADLVRWEVSCLALSRYESRFKLDRCLKWTDVAPGLVFVPAGVAVLVLQNYFDRERAESAARDLIHGNVDGPRALVGATFELHRSAVATRVLLDWMKEYSELGHGLRAKITRPWRQHVLHGIDSDEHEGALGLAYRAEVRRRLTVRFGYELTAGGGLAESMHTPERHAAATAAYAVEPTYTGGPER